jgi:hypothetical protein
MIPDRLPLARRLRRVFWPVSIQSEIDQELRTSLLRRSRGSGSIRC